MLLELTAFLSSWRNMAAMVGNVGGIRALGLGSLSHLFLFGVLLLLCLLLTTETIAWVKTCEMHEDRGAIPAFLLPRIVEESAGTAIYSNKQHRRRCRVTWPRVFLSGDHDFETST